MANIIFGKTWMVNEILTNADAPPSISIYNNTTNTQVVTGGTMNAIGTGNYQYVFGTAVVGNLYTATITTTYLTVPYVSTTFGSVAGTTTPGANAPVTSSSAGVALIQQQLGDIIASKEIALQSLATVLTAGLGPSYTIAGRAGSETVSMTQFLEYLKGQVSAFGELEKMLFQLLQDLQPFTQVVHHQVGDAIRGQWGGGYRGGIW